MSGGGGVQDCIIFRVDFDVDNIAILNFVKAEFIAELFTELQCIVQVYLIKWLLSVFVSFMKLV